MEELDLEFRAGGTVHMFVKVMMFLRCANDKYLSGFILAFKRADAELNLAYDESKIPADARVPEWFRALLFLFNAKLQDWQRTLVVVQTDLEGKPWELTIAMVEKQLRAIAQSEEQLNQVEVAHGAWEEWWEEEEADDDGYTYELYEGSDSPYFDVASQSFLVLEHGYATEAEWVDEEQAFFVRKQIYNPYHKGKSKGKGKFRSKGGKPKGKFFGDGKGPQMWNKKGFLTQADGDGLISAFMSKGKGKSGGSSVEGNESSGIKNANEWTCFDCGSAFHLRGNPACKNRVTRGTKKFAARMAVAFDPDLVDDDGVGITIAKLCENVDVAEYLDIWMMMNYQAADDKYANMLRDSNFESEAGSPSLAAPLEIESDVLREEARSWLRAWMSWRFTTSTPSVSHKMIEEQVPKSQKPEEGSENLGESRPEVRPDHERKTLGEDSDEEDEDYESEWDHDEGPSDDESEGAPPLVSDSSDDEQEPKPKKKRSAQEKKQEKRRLRQKENRKKRAQLKEVKQESACMAKEYAAKSAALLPAYLSDVGSTEAVVDTACTRAMSCTRWVEQYAAKAKELTGRESVPEHSSVVYGFAGGEPGKANYAMRVPKQIGTTQKDLRVETGSFADTPCLYSLNELEEDGAALYFSKDPTPNYISIPAQGVHLRELRKNSHGLLLLDLLQGAKEGEVGDSTAYAARKRLRGKQPVTKEKEESPDEEEEETATEENAEEKALKKEWPTGEDGFKEQEKVPKPVDKEFIKSFHERFGHAPPTKIAKALIYLKDPMVLKMATEVYKECRRCQLGGIRPRRPRGGGAVVSYPGELFGMVSFKFPQEHHRFSVIKGLKMKIIQHFVDALSRKSFAYPQLKETADWVIRSLRKLRAEAGLPKTMIRDNMRSNVADAVCEYLEGYAVDMPTTGAESPWQNNLAEGKNRILEHILDKVCMEFRADLESGKLEFEDILLDSLAAMDELPGSTSVKGKSPYELWHGRHPPTMPSPDSAHPQQLTDDLCDQVDLLETLRIRSQQIAQEARTDKVLREIFRKNIRPSRGPFHVGDMVYFWSGTSKKDTERWTGPAEIVLVDRTENCHCEVCREGVHEVQGPFEVREAADERSCGRNPR